MEILMAIAGAVIIGFGLFFAALPILIFVWLVRWFLRK